MPIEVFDFRTDLRNIYVSPKMRGRFLRHVPGEVGPFPATTSAMSSS